MKDLKFSAVRVGSSVFVTVRNRGPVRAYNLYEFAQVGVLDPYPECYGRDCTAAVCASLVRRIASERGFRVRAIR